MVVVVVGRLVVVARVRRNAVPVQLSSKPGESPRCFHGRGGETQCTDWISRNPRDADRGDNPSKGDEMNTEAQSQDRDPEATTGRFPLAVFVLVELLCTGALVASVIFWM